MGNYKNRNYEEILLYLGESIFNTEMPLAQTDRTIVEQKEVPCTCYLLV